MSSQEQQEEELEVLHSIYDGDENFKEINPTKFQYKIGEKETLKSFVLEVQWPDGYPDDLPDVNLDAFYNKHLVPDVKTNILERLKEQAVAEQGCAMTYTLFEWAKENAEDILTSQPDTIVQTHSITTNTAPQQGKAKEKKEQLTKSQKRKMVNRLDNKGELPRGHDWVDIIKHLCQTGGSRENDAE